MTAVAKHLQAALGCEACGDVTGALAHYRLLQAQQPDHPDACLRLAQTARTAHQYAAAERYIGLALTGAQRLGLRADAAPLFVELSAQWLQRGDANQALRCIREGQSICGEIASLIWQECEVLRAQDRALDRAKRLNRLAALQPRDPVVLVELGLALIKTTSAPQAIKPLRAAFAMGYADHEVALSLADVELHVGDFSAAESRLRNLRAENPDHLGALGKLWQLLRQQCRWLEATDAEVAIVERLAAGECHAALTPFMLLASDLASPFLLNYTAVYGRQSSRDFSAGIEAPCPVRPRASGAPLRVGYLSSDFHHHATAMLMVGVFESHSTHIECFAYSYGPRTDDDYRRRLKLAIPSWRDINELSDEAAARQMRTDGIDILVELKGLTFGARLGICAHRPAPVVMHYLGYPGTLVSPGIDFIVADPIITPPESNDRYAETVLRLPICYQANDAKRIRPVAVPRTELGLPEGALVLCNFNQSYKWSERFMRVWLRTLQRAPHAVLWLLDPGDATRRAVMMLAQEYGVTTQVHWATPQPVDLHLARLAAANLALDQLPYASHTTGSDALWMGVPMLTCVGGAFQGRVGASLVAAAGLPDLAKNNIDDYERALLEFVIQPSLLRELQAEFSARISAMPLFDTVGFTKQWEALLLQTFVAKTSKNVSL